MNRCCEEPMRDACASVPEIERVCYFFGQLLGPDEFQTEHEFFATETKARVTFAKLDSGKAAQYTVEIDGVQRVYQRLDAADEVPPNLPDYAGHYRSEELETSWSVQVKEGKLVLQHLRHGEIPLRPMARDRFNGSNLGSLQFERDSAAKVTGLKVTTGRIRNLRKGRVNEKVNIQRGVDPLKGRKGGQDGDVRSNDKPANRRE